MQIKQSQVQLNDEETVESTVVLLNDKSSLSVRRLRDSGEMIAECTIARTGIMLYKAKELGEVAAHLPPEQVCRVRTKPEVLFDEATIEGCRSIPVTIGHPKDDVNIRNNKELQKGFIEGRPVADGSFLAAAIVLNDEAAIRLVDSGIDQISLGHNATIVPCADEEADFDKIKIVPNHAAIVQRGRAQTTRIGDSGDEIEIVDKSQLDLVEAQRDALQARVDSMTAKLADAESARLTDEEMQAQVDAKVESRFELLLSVAKLGDEFASMDFKGKTEAEIKRAVVCKIMDSDLSGKSDGYVEARFDVALEDSSEVTLSDALSISMQAPEPKHETKPSVRDEALKRRNARFNK